MASIHSRKLKKLSLENELEPCNPEKVVHNHSSVPLPFRLKILLAYGLDFKLPHFKINFHNFYRPIEHLAHRLSKETCSPGKSFGVLLEKLAFISKKFFYTFKPEKVFSPVFEKSDIELIRKLGKRPDLYVSTPDKGKGVVLVDKSTYLSSMLSVVNDTTKFQPITERIERYCLQIEDKINRFLLKMKNMGNLDGDTYQKLYASGSGPGILYGKPKIHKTDFSQKFQFRPILAAYNQASYKISKFIVPIISHLTSKRCISIESK